MSGEAAGQLATYSGAGAGAVVLFGILVRIILGALKTSRDAADASVATVLESLAATRQEAKLNRERADQAEAAAREARQAAQEARDSADQARRGQAAAERLTLMAMSWIRQVMDLWGSPRDGEPARHLPELPDELMTALHRLVD